MNRIENREEAARVFRNAPAKLEAFDRRGNLLVGDVNPLDMAEVAGAYTPVPGGVGPLTIAMLMANTVASAEKRLATAGGAGFSLRGASAPPEGCPTKSC
jgi:methylenetetrahydrofolate dehydrogenase (NADP+)/methenyltetrahydrofolate cyclohydrolase